METFESEELYDTDLDDLDDDDLRELIPMNGPRKRFKKWLNSYKKEKSDIYTIQYEQFRDKSFSWDTQQIKNYDWFINSGHKIGNKICSDDKSTIYRLKIPQLSHFGSRIKIYECDNKKQVLKIMQEYMIVSKLHLLIYYNLCRGKMNTQIYITMEPLEYSLSSAIKHNLDDEIHDFKCIKDSIGLQYFIIEIAASLHSMHSNGYLHGNISPKNVMFRNHGGERNHIFGNGWKLIDFSNTKYINTKLNGFIKLDHFEGKYGWTSPEQNPFATKTNPNLISTKSDIFAFGLLILYIINNGVNEFGHKLKSNLINEEADHLMDEYLCDLCKKNKIIHYELYDLLKNMLKYNQSERLSAIDITRETVVRFANKPVHFNAIYS